MPRNPLQGLPFPPLKTIDQDAPIDLAGLNALLEQSRDSSISMLVRSESGHPDRGGYFFHIRKQVGERKPYLLYDFQQTLVASMDEEDIVLLINHCSGREYSERSYSVCQNEINLRDDQ